MKERERTKEKAKNQNANERFTEVGNEIPGNAAVSLGETSGGSGGNRVNFADRGFLISQETSGRNDWEINPCGGMAS